MDLKIKPKSFDTKPKPYYPSLEIEGEYEVGDEVCIRGVVTRCVETEDSCHCTIECHECNAEDDSLDKAMIKIAKKKVQELEDNDE